MNTELREVSSGEDPNKVTVYFGNATFGNAKSKTFVFDKKKLKIQEALLEKLQNIVKNARKLTKYLSINKDTVHASSNEKIVFVILSVQLEDIREHQ